MGIWFVSLCLVPFPPKIWTWIHLHIMLLCVCVCVLWAFHPTWREGLTLNVRPVWVYQDMIRSSGVHLHTNIFLASSFYHRHDRHYWWRDLSLSVPGPSDATVSGVILQPYEDQAWPLGLALYSHPSWLWQHTATTYISHHLTSCCTTGMPIFHLRISSLLKHHPCSFIMQI